MIGTLAVVSTGRQDYGILRSTLLALRAAPGIETRLVVGGMHLDPRFGTPRELPQRDGIAIAVEVPFLVKGQAPAAEFAAALDGFGRAFDALRPEAVLLVGDRTETLAAGVAATLGRIPVVHLHGGEETEGAIDNVCRHALTKLSHLHLVSHEVHAARVRQMGENPAAVQVVGAPGLDNLYRDDLPDRAALATRLGVELRDPILLVTVHPATLGAAPDAEARAVAAALRSAEGTVIVTQPNSDPGADAIREVWRSSPLPSGVVVDALGADAYWGLLRMAAAVVGNSSSGIIEAPQIGVPVVNVGDRQRGRLRARGVEDVPAEAKAIADAIGRALLPATRAAVRATPAPYPDGAAAPRIVAALRAWTPPVPPRKPFVDRSPA